jgi:hypothetical protein
MKVGDYVRTKKKTLQPPQIARIKSMQKDSGYHNLYYIELDHNLIPYYNFHIYADDIDKSSPNIIDLIEVGDIVNGVKVINIGKEQGKNIEIYLDTKDLFEQDIYNNNDIKSIVTKEQFEAMQYKVDDK